MRFINLYRLFLPVLILLCLPVSMGNAMDFSILGRELNVTGYLSQEAAFAVHSDKSVAGRHYDEPGLHSAYYTVYLDSTLWLSQDLHVRMINRLMGDWVFNIKEHDDSWEQRGFGSSGVRKALHIEDNLHEVLREFYINYMHGNLNVRLGKQQIAWGESDGLRLCDIINPLDLSREAIFRDSDEGYETTRIPLLLARINYTFGDMEFGPVYEPEIEFVFNPGDIRRNRSPEGSVWQVHDPLLPPGISVNIKDDRKGRNIRHREWGFRLKGNILDTFLTLNFYSGYLHDPVVRSTGFDPATFTLHIKKEYEKVHSYGLTASRELYCFRKMFKSQINPVLRIEFLYQQDYPYNTERFPEVLTTRKELDKKDVIRYMLGFDWPVKIDFLNPERNFFVSGQFFHYHILNYPDNYELQNGPYSDWTAREDQFYSTLLMRTSYLHDLIKPQVLGVVDWTYGTYWLKPKIRFEWGNNWRPEIGGIFVFAGHDDYRREFGHWADRDEVYFKLAYQF